MDRVSVFDDAFEIAAKTRASGALLVRDPLTEITGVCFDYEAPARWRVGSWVWDELREEAKRVNGMAAPSDATGTTLLGYPLVVDEAADPSTMVLEPTPTQPPESGEGGP